MKKHLSLIVIGSLCVCVLLSGCIENKPPTVNIIALPTVGVAPMNVSFIANATDPDGTIDTYLWDFDDGNTSQEKNPTHYFTNPDSYNVSLTVTDNSGDSATSYTIITLVPPQVVFNPTAEADTSGTSNETILYCEKYILVSETGIVNVSHKEIYLKFNLSAIPDGIHVDNATIKLFVTDLGFFEKQGYEKGIPYPKFDNSGYLFIAVYECENTSWSASELNEVNAPVYNRTPIDYQQITSYEGSGENIWISWNMTSFLQKIFVNTSKVFTLVLNVEPDPYQSGLPITYGYASFRSTQGALSQGNQTYPQLIVNFSTG
ncbi:MAG: hypothetical protein BV458_08790 [Thermoplasmata archaeon M9B2D]|nr:MAG: hypothetical protein BV458_08790 [Thermoplasmata archaeon M9B2D]